VRKSECERVNYGDPDPRSRLRLRSWQNVRAIRLAALSLSSIMSTLSSWLWGTTQLDEAIGMI
jgi:hypothetical protein